MGLIAFSGFWFRFWARKRQIAGRPLSVNNVIVILIFDSEIGITDSIRDNVISCYFNSDILTPRLRICTFVRYASRVAQIEFVADSSRTQKEH